METYYRIISETVLTKIGKTLDEEGLENTLQMLLFKNPQITDLKHVYITMITVINQLYRAIPYQTVFTDTEKQLVITLATTFYNLDYRCGDNLEFNDDGPTPEQLAAHDIDKEKYANYLLEGIVLLKEHPTSLLILQQFSELIYLFNAYGAPHSFNQDPWTDTDAAIRDAIVMTNHFKELWEQLLERSN